jgi:hypothetical protein
VPQPIDATHALNLSAGVSNPKVLRITNYLGISFLWSTGHQRLLGAILDLNSDVTECRFRADTVEKLDKNEGLFFCK